MAVLQIMWMGLAIAAALAYFGWGAAHLGWPRGEREWAWLGAPVVGYALVAAFDYAALFFGLNLTTAAVLLLALSTLLNLLAWRKKRNVPAGGMTHERAIVLGFMALTFAFAAAPLVRYGYRTLIGENWDFEFYLPLARYLAQYTIPQLSNAPSNPLLETITGRHIGPLPMGFTYLHTTVNLLFGWDPLDSFPILAAVLHALGVVSAFLFFRMSLRMGAARSLTASALYASSGLLLWVTFWAFGLHLASLALLPLAIGLGAHALLQRDMRALPLAALLLGALNITFHPALVAALLPLGLLGLYLLITQDKRARTLAMGAGLLALAALVSFPALFHVSDFVREYYGRAPLATGLRDFVPATDALGVSLYTVGLVVGQTIPTPWLYSLARLAWDWTAIPLGIGALAAGVAGLWSVRQKPDTRLQWWLIAFALAAYVLVFRLPFLRPYPYGFLKALTLTIFMLSALVVQGAWPASRVGTEQWRKWLPAAGVGFLTVFLGANLFTLGISLEQYFKPAPAFFDADALSIREARSVLPSGASVYLTDRGDASPTQMALAAYALMDFPLYGQTRTGYADFSHLTPGAVYDYALLSRGESAALRGYGTAPVWSNALWALYPRPVGLVTHLDVREDLSSGAVRTLSVSASQIVTGTARLGGTAADLMVRLGVSSLVTQTVEVRDGERTQTVTISPGFAILSQSYRTPVTLSLRTVTDSAPLYWAYAEVWDPQSPFVPAPDLLVARAESAAEGETVSSAVRLVNPSHARLQWTFVLRGTLATGRRQEQLFIQQGITAAPDRQVTTVLDSRRGTLQFDVDLQVPVSLSFVPLQAGKYRASLEVSSSGILRGRIELYEWTQRTDGGRMNPASSAPVLLSP